MNYIFEELCERHREPVIDIYNHYIENSFSAYPEQRVPYEFFVPMLDKVKGYPAFAIKDAGINRVVGFCFLKMYHPFTVFKETAEITYFIDPTEVGKGIGKLALTLLEDKGREMGVKQILASISSKNEQSLNFHIKNGFKECGRFINTGKKRGEYFDIIWMQKSIN